MTSGCKPPELVAAAGNYFCRLYYDNVFVLFFVRRELGPYRKRGDSTESAINNTTSGEGELTREVGKVISPARNQKGWPD